MIPAAFVIGLVLIPIGLRLDARRRRRAPDTQPADWPVLDFRIARQRKIIAVVVALTCVNLILLSMASFGAVHYWYDQHRVTDFTLDVDANPDLARGQALLMGYLYRPYTANTGWVRLRYRW